MTWSEMGKGAAGAIVKAAGSALGLFTGGGFTSLVASLLVGVALGSWGSWRVQEWRHAELARKIAERDAKAQKEARADEMVRIRNTERITDEQDRRLKATAARLVVSLRTVDGLRDEVRRLNDRAVPEDPGASASAREASAARNLLGECAAAYQRVDGRAQELGDQVTGLQDFVATSCRAGR